MSATIPARGRIPWVARACCPRRTEQLSSLGTGTFTQTGGTNLIASQLNLGYNASSGPGTYNLSGSGLLSVATVTEAYNAGTGNFFSVRRHGHDLAASCSSATPYHADGRATYTLGGGLLSTPYESVGHGSSGTLTQSGGTNAVSELDIGGYQAGVYDLNGGVASRL